MGTSENLLEQRECGLEGEVEIGKKCHIYGTTNQFSK